MKCNFECPFNYRYEYHNANSCPIFYDRCRIHSTWFDKRNPKPELCDMPEQRKNKMKELIGSEVSNHVR